MIHYFTVFFLTPKNKLSCYYKNGCDYHYAKESVILVRGEKGIGNYYTVLFSI